MAKEKDPLERIFTPEALSIKIVQWLSARWGVPPAVIEPSVGEGSFVQAFRSVWGAVPVIGIDIDPDAKGGHLCDAFYLQDWVEWAERYGPRIAQNENLCVVANPPFSRAASHIRAALTITDRVAMLLPADLPGRSVRTPWPDLFREHGATSYVINHRPWPTSREMSIYTFDEQAPKAGVFVMPERLDWYVKPRKPKKTKGETA